MSSESATSGSRMPSFRYQKVSETASAAKSAACRASQRALMPMPRVSALSPAEHALAACQHEERQCQRERDGEAESDVLRQAHHGGRARGRVGALRVDAEIEGEFLSKERENQEHDAGAESLAGALLASKQRVGTF